MRGRFNEPCLMGNCANCYYFTPNPMKGSDDGLCHRYPKPIDIGKYNYCGEFALKRDVANVGGGSE